MPSAIGGLHKKWFKFKIFDVVQNSDHNLNFDNRQLVKQGVVLSELVHMTYQQNVYKSTLEIRKITP